MIPGCLPGREEGVGWPEPILLFGDWYENMFLCGVVGVIKAGCSEIELRGEVYAVP